MPFLSTLSPFGFISNGLPSKFYRGIPLSKIAVTQKLDLPVMVYGRFSRMHLRGFLSFSGGSQNGPCSKFQKRYEIHIFSSKLFAIRAFLNQFWKQSWLKWNCLGPQNGCANLIILSKNCCVGSAFGVVLEPLLYAQYWLNKRPELDPKRESPKKSCKLVTKTKVWL